MKHQPIWLNRSTFLWWLQAGMLNVTWLDTTYTYATDEFGLIFFTQLEG